MKVIVSYMTRPYFIVLLLMIGSLAGCSGMKTYSNDLDNNLHITAETDSGSVFSKIRTAVDIYKVNPDCTTEYDGTVQLDSPSVDIGIPSGRSSYLVFVFDSSGLFSANSSTMYDTLLRPRAGYRYDASVSYKEDIYNVVIKEVTKGNMKSRELDTKGMSACRPV